MSNVVSPWGYIHGAPEVNEDLINMLKGVLEMAEAGEVIGGSVSFIYKDGLAGYRIGGRIGGYSILGATVAMENRLKSIIADE